MGPKHLCLRFEFQGNLQFYDILFNEAINLVTGVRQLTCIQ